MRKSSALTILSSLIICGTAFTLGLLTDYGFLFVVAAVSAGIAYLTMRPHLTPAVNAQRVTLMNEYHYKYQRHPFDDTQYFSIWANSRAEADNKAKRYFQELFNRKVTVMTEFYPVNDDR